MGHKVGLSAIVGSVIVLLARCGGCYGKAGGTTEITQQAYSPHINPAAFTTTIVSKYFPLKPGTTFVYQAGPKTLRCVTRWPSPTPPSR